MSHSAVLETLRREEQTTWTSRSLIRNKYPPVILHSHGKSPFLIGKPSINEPFPMDMLNHQRVSFKVVSKPTST